MNQEFRWSVAQSYEWREVRTWGHHRLDGATVPVLCPVGGVRREYSPLTDARRLYLEFAALPGGGAGFRDFATEYGLLGLPLYPPHDGAGELADDLPEFSSWGSTYSGIVQAVWRWDVLKGRQPWTDAEDYFVPRHDTALPIPTRADARRRFVTHHVLDQISALVTDGLVRNQVGPTVGHVAVGRTGRFTLDYQPRTLAGALWLQVAWAVTGREDFAQCLRCQKWLEPGVRKRGKAKPRGRRADVKFCSDLCRATWHQEQKRQLQ